MSDKQKEEKTQRRRQLTELSLLEANSKCFDCDYSNAIYTSINNGIFLCINCANIHKGLGEEISTIKSITSDNWDEIQINKLRISGNLRLKKFLQLYDIYRKVPPENLYSSDMMKYYRNMIEAEAQGEPFKESIPENDLISKMCVIPNSIQNKAQNLSLSNNDIVSCYEQIKAPSYDHVDDTDPNSYQKMDDKYTRISNCNSIDDDDESNNTRYFFPDEFYELNWKEKLYYIGFRTYHYLISAGGYIFEKGKAGFLYVRGRFYRHQVKQISESEIKKSELNMNYSELEDEANIKLIDRNSTLLDI